MVIRRNKSGYKVFTDSNGVTRSVHKRVLEKKLGGKVWRGYQAHHKNGNKNDNRPSNIQAIKENKHRKIHYKKRSF